MNVHTAVGKAAPFVHLRIVDENMEDIPAGEDQTGEIVTRAPWLTHEYLNNPDASRNLWHGGWLHTGDVGYLDETGTLHITDRIKDVIKSGGEWISSLELENLASSIDGVSEVATIGIPNAKWAVPEKIEFLDQLPKTSVGKLDKKAMRSQFSSNSD